VYVLLSIVFDLSLLSNCNKLPSGASVAVYLVFINPKLLDQISFNKLGLKHNKVLHCVV